MNLVVMRDIFRWFDRVLTAISPPGGDLHSNSNMPAIIKWKFRAKFDKKTVKYFRITFLKAVDGYCFESFSILRPKNPPRNRFDIWASRSADKAEHESCNAIRVAIVYVLASHAVVFRGTEEGNTTTHFICISNYKWYCKSIGLP